MHKKLRLKKKIKIMKKRKKRGKITTDLYEFFSSQ